MCVDTYIIESSGQKRFKCPYCELRLERGKLIKHIDKIHEDLIPSDYTSTRIVFNIVNRKSIGNCVECRRETPWNDNIARYERYCIDNNGKCKDAASAKAKKNMVRVYGKEHLLDDDDHQIKMLANRSISGTYKFSTGGSATYTGSYEMKLLKFLDSWGFRAIDLLTPGPSVIYEFEGRKRTWITDLYLIPYNLVFDVKDGGDNPNNRRMDEYRAKQDAKEAAIIKQGKYNYIRLTDNNFEQLLLILAELKYQLVAVDKPNRKLISKINENTAMRIDEDCSDLIGDTTQYSSIEEYSNAVIGTMANTGDNIYIVPYLKNNSFNVEYGVSDNIVLDSIFITNDNGDIEVKNNKFLKEECEVFKIFKFIKPSGKRIEDPSNLAEALTGKKMLDPNQILYDKDFEQVIPFDQLLRMAEDSFVASLKGTKYEIPVVGESSIIESSQDVSYYRDDNGYFIKNEVTNLRSKSFDRIDGIGEDLYKFIEKGML